MRKYKIGRALAWLLVAAGFLFFALWLALGVIAAFSGFRSGGGPGFLPAGAVLAGQMLGAGFLGLIAALAGFLCLAFFDFVEAYVQRGQITQEPARADAQPLT